MSDKVSQQDINDTLWRACDTFRGTLDPSQYKDYLLVMLFLKYMSDVWTDKRDEYHKKYRGDDVRIDRALARERFVVPAASHFKYLYDHRDAANVGELINIALEKIEDANRAKLENVFRNIDFNSEPHLGETKDRNRRLKNLLQDFANPILDLRPSRIGNLDVIGNAYEYLIGHFASDAGKKGGEFYTPGEVATLLAKLVDPKPGETICDPACGSGSLLIHVAREVRSDNYYLYGQEVNGGTWALCKMNMFLHGVDNARIEWGDTLNSPKLVDGTQLMKFDVVVANPPFSLDKWGAEHAAGDPFHRFHRGTPPKSKADYAFISHMIETAAEDGGRVGVIVPHGVLFRGGAEGKIRQQLIDANLLDAVIGLPANLFFGTGIPAAILLFRKGRKTTDVMFVDASRDYDDGKNQSRLRPQDIEKLVATVMAGKTITSYAQRVTANEIKGHEYNLNIARYVDTFVEPEDIDLEAVGREIQRLEAELSSTRDTIDVCLAALGMSTRG
ncbi:MAG: type I restriction-modification system subunit M [Gemmatimonadaceae bacterium]